MKTLSITEICTKLNCKKRSALSWCENNGVPVFSQGKQNHFVYETHFYAAFDKPLIQKLQLQYPSDWPRVYEIIKSGNIVDYYTLTISTVNVVQQFRTKNKTVNEYREKYNRFLQ